jgi:chromosome condensin MukBEF ATPase and DNA-binding subunit MukB
LEQQKAAAPLGELMTGLALVRQSLEALRADVAKIEMQLSRMLDQQGQRITALERECLKRCTVLDTDTLRSQVVEHEERLDRLEALAPAIRVVIWIGAALGVSVLGLIWGLITGAVQLAP